MKTHAFPLQLAQEAILLGRYADAIELLRPLSEDDTNPDAQFLHSYLHFWDDNLSRTQALDSITYLANSDHAEANYILAICPDLSPGYHFSLPERSEQLDRLQTAADLGSVYALTDLAECYLEGLISDSDPDKTYGLLALAFHIRTFQIYPKIYFLMGKMLVEEFFGEQDLVRGLRFLAGASSIKDDPIALDALQLAFDILDNLNTEDTAIDIIRRESFERIQRDTVFVYKPRWECFLHHYCMTNIKYDLIDADFDTFTDFVFDRYPRRRQDGDSFRWKNHAEVKADPQQLLQYYTELFQNPAFLVDRFSDEQIIQAFEMRGIRGWQDWTIGCLMFHPRSNTTVDDVVACIRAMVGLFEHLFNRASFLDVGYMWWDIGYGTCKNTYKYDPDYKPKFTEDERIRIGRANLDTMIDVLNMKSLEMQKAAIHGFGHRGFPEDTERILRQYLDDNPDHPAWIREYAEAAIEGKII